MPSGRISGFNCCVRWRWPGGKGKLGKPFSGGSRRRGARYPMKHMTPLTPMAPEIDASFFQRVMAAFGMGNKFK